MSEEKSIEEVKATANVFKEEGNALLAQNKYAAAAEKYTQAIELFPTAVYYANRAQAQIKLESFGAAIQDANEAIKLDPTYIKAYYRRASCYFVLNHLKDALKDFKAVVKIVPKDPDALKKLKACEKAVREEAFNKAIESERTADEIVDVSSITVDASYTGPRLPDTSPDGTVTVTPEFVQELITHLRDQKSLHRKYLIQLLNAARDMFSKLPSLIRLSIGDGSTSDPENAAVEGTNPHFTVCGDTHGQFYDLLNIFSIGGFPSPTNPYLFNGDFVDRGSFSLENVITLMAIKLSCPTSLHMLRGNHETLAMNKMYGFEGEVLHKYDKTVMKLFNQVFNWLPLAAVIQDKIFVVHGGITTENNGVVSLAAIEAIPRNKEPPEEGLMHELLWTDPQPMLGRSPSKRGLGFCFGPDYTENFLAANNLKLLVRSHEMQERGYVVGHNGKCITVFSAPNYCDQMGNEGAFIRFGPDLEPQFTQFSHVQHPSVPAMAYARNIFGM